MIRINLLAVEREREALAGGAGGAAVAGPNVVTP